MEHLFIVTYGRSGSTLLMNLLNAVEGYCIRGENGGAIEPIAEAARRLRHRHRANARYDDKGSEGPWFGVSEIDPDHYARQLAESFTQHILRPEAGTRVCGFKEIRYTPLHQDDTSFHNTIGFLANDFPGARVIFNTRNAAEVAKSGWWSWQKTARDVRKMVGQCDQRFRVAQERLGDRAFTIDYAQYNGKPEGFAPLLEWLGESIPAERIEEIGAKRLTHSQGLPRGHKTLKWQLRQRIREWGIR